MFKFEALNFAFDKNDVGVKHCVWGSGCFMVTFPKWTLYYLMGVWFNENQRTIAIKTHVKDNRLHCFIN